MTLQRDPSPQRPPIPTGGTITVDLAWNSVVIAGVASIALVAVWGAIRSASSVVMIIVMALFLAMALDPVVVTVSRWLRLGRGPTTAIILAIGLVLTGVFIGVAGPQLVTESGNLERELPATIESFNDVPLVGHLLAGLDLSDRLNELLAALPDRVDSSGSQVGSVLRAASYDIGVVLLAGVLLAGALLEGPRLIGDIRRSIPARRRDRADDVGRTVYAVLARYFAGSLLVALLNGVWVASFALAAGVPLSPVLGVWSAVTCLIPQLGGLLGFVVVFVVSLTAGVVPTLVMSVAFLAFLLLNNHLLNPMIVGHSVSLSAPVTMIAAIAGFSVAGIVGALVAVPTFGAIKAVAQLFDGRGITTDQPASSSGTSKFRTFFARLGRRSDHREANADMPSGGADVSSGGADVPSGGDRPDS